MKATLRFLWLCTFSIVCFHTSKVFADDTNGFRLTVELRDGSKLIGKAGDENYQFHSDALGEMKLPLEKIRSIECQAKTNLVKLTTSSGDSLTVQFATKEIHIQTSFGNFKLPTNLIKRIQISSMGKPGRMHPGLVALWSGEGNGSDSVGGNNATLTDISFADGQVGQAFSLNGTSSYVSIPDSPLLNLFTNSITIELWLKVNRLTVNPNWEWIVTKGNSSWRLVGVPGAKTIIFYASGTSTTDIMPSTRNVNDGQWHHVAGVYDGTNISLYVDGTLDVSQPDTGLILQNNYPLCIGQNLEVSGGDAFNGLIDEVSIYNRALSADEIKAICTEENGGKPLPQ